MSKIYKKLIAISGLPSKLFQVFIPIEFAIRLAELISLCSCSTFNAPIFFLSIGKMTLTFIWIFIVRVIDNTVIESNHKLSDLFIGCILIKELYFLCELSKPFGLFISDIFIQFLENLL